MAITYARALVHEAFQGRGRGRGQAQAGSYAEGKDFSLVEAQQVVTEPPGCIGHETGDQRAFPGAVVAAENQGAPMQAHGRGMEGDQAGAGMTAGGHQLDGQAAQHTGPGGLVAGSGQPGRAQAIAAPLWSDAQQGHSFVQAGWQRPGDGREPRWLRGVRPEPEKSIQCGQQALAVMQSHGSRHTGKKDVLVRHA